VLPAGPSSILKFILEVRPLQHSIGPVARDDGTVYRNPPLCRPGFPDFVIALPLSSNLRHRKARASALTMDRDGVATVLAGTATNFLSLRLRMDIGAWTRTTPTCES
jgi:hypothetical protein